ncbi:MAG: hypothetical protein WD793_05590 [Steroidobacteraceae bacterium]
MAAGILAKKEIAGLIADGKLVTNGDLARAQGCSYDMVVGTVFDNGHITRLHEDSERQIIVPAGGIVSLFTADELRLPNDIAAFAFAINEMSSRGFLVLNPGHVDPGYCGPLTVKALNLRKSRQVLQAGEPVFTVIFFRLEHDTEAYPKTGKRSDLEREFNRRDIEVSPRSLADAYESSGTGVFPTTDQVDRLITKHWASWIAMGLAFIGALAAIVAAIAAVAVIKGDAPQSNAPDVQPANQQAPREFVPTNTSVEKSKDLSNNDFEKPRDSDQNRTQQTDSK